MHTVLDMSVPFNVVTWSLFLIAFFSMSRKSNLVPTQGQKLKHHINRRNIKLINDVLFIKFKSSKTNQDGSRYHIVPLPSIDNSVLCPVSAYRNMCKCVNLPSKDLPAFSYRKSNNKIVPYTYMLISCRH